MNNGEKIYIKRFRNLSNSEKIMNSYHPFHIKTMEEVICRIIKAINNREKIVVFGYYDVDRITSISILLLVLRYLNADVEFFIPNEIRNVKNLTNRDIKEHIEFLGTKLIISVGGYLNTEDEIDLCRKLNIDMITLCNEKDKINPYGYSINPSYKDSTYGFKGLSYTGVTFKLIQALGIYYRTSIFNKFIDLACIGTISSGKVIEGENLYILRKGLERINNTHNYGLKALKEMCNLKEIHEEDIRDIVRFLKPRINPMGNMDDAKIIVDLFTTRDIYKAKQIVKYIQR